MPTSPKDKPVLLSDLTGDLLWPRLLSVVPLSLGINRLFASFIAVVLCALIARVPLAWEDNRSLADLWWQQMPAIREADDTLPVIAPLLRFIADPALTSLRLLHDHPGALATAVPMVLFSALFAACVSHSAAMSFGRRTPVGFAPSFAAAIRSYPAVVVAMGWPFAVVGVIGLLIASVGFVFLTWDFGRTVGGILFGLPLLISALAVLLLGAWIVAWPLLVPAAMCEAGPSGSAGDGLDATQRVLAYVYNSPLRLGVYAGICALQVVVARIAYSTLMIATADFARWSSSWFVARESADAFYANPETIATKGVMFWVSAMQVLGAAFLFSLVVCSGTAVYLLIRRLCDGQDESEIPCVQPRSDD